MSQIGTKAKNDLTIYEMAVSGWFRMTPEGRVETCYQWRACREYYDRPWFVCDRPDGKGYRYISFRHHRVKAHRLAYVLYTGEPLDGLEINHIDGNKLNNLESNLELCTAHRQSKHAYDIGLNKSRGVGHPKAIFCEDDIRTIRILHDCGKSKSEIARLYKTSATNIRYVVIGKTWKHVKEIQ